MSNVYILHIVLHAWQVDQAVAPACSMLETATKHHIALSTLDVDETKFSPEVSVSLWLLWPQSRWQLRYHMQYLSCAQKSAP